MSQNVAYIGSKNYPLPYVDEEGNLAYDDDKYDVYIYDSTIDFNIVDYSNITASVFTVSITGNYAHTVLYQPEIATKEYVKEYVDDTVGIVNNELESILAGGVD